MYRATVAQIENLSKKFIIDPTNGCWIWQSAITNVGYGTVEISHKQTSAHKWVFAICRGYWPPSTKTLDHLCRNRRCVNPNHLEVVTFRTNVLRGEGVAAYNSRKTHCKNGHKFTPENTYYRQRPGRNIERACRACMVRASREYRNKKERIAISGN